MDLLRKAGSRLFLEKQLQEKEEFGIRTNSVDEKFRIFHSDCAIVLLPSKYTTSSSSKV